MLRNMSEMFDDDLELFDRRVSRMLDAFRTTQEHRARSRTWRPPTDVFETDDAIIVKIEIAGMDAAGFEVSFVDRVLTVQGVRPDVESKMTYHCLEIPYGEFQTRVLIPGAYVEDKIEGRYENGYLYVTLPKSKDEHRIPVRKIEPSSTEKRVNIE